MAYVISALKAASAVLEDIECGPEELARLNIREEALSRRSLFDRVAINHFRRICRDRKVDIIHTHDAASQFTAAWARLTMKRIPLLMTFHRTLGQESATTSDRLRNAFACTQSGAIVTGSNERRRHFVERNFVSPQKVFQIPFGTDLRRFRPDFRDREYVEGSSALAIKRRFWARSVTLD